MATKEEDFKERFVAVMRDLKEHGAKDPEAMWVLGSFATRLTNLSKRRTWTEFKAALTAPAYDQLLNEFQTQGNAYYRQRNAHAAYAIELLALSVVARTQRDPQVREGEKLLDQAISAAVAFYRKAKADRAAKAG
jgi:hypothetical protein